MATSTEPVHLHPHREPKGEALAEAARGVMERGGERWTAMRAAVFDALAGFDKPASAYDVTEAISRAQGRRVAANSVYRILDLFVGNNLARRVESRNAYVINAHPDCLHDCIFLMCDACGRTIHVDDDAVTARVRAVAVSEGYVPERPVIEVRGRCADCAVG